MPLPPPGPKTPKEPTSELLYRTSLRDFEQKAILYGLATVGLISIWIPLRHAVPGQLAWVVVAAVAIEAGKNIKRWWEWRQATSRTGLVHPDRQAEMQQAAVKRLGDAARPHARFTYGLVVCISVPTLLELVAGLDRAVAAASVDPEAVRAGAWWRLLGGTYLHGSYYHFTGNMSALLLYGSILESKTSAVRVPLVYLVSCVAGSLLSVATPPDVPAIGASGGVVGIIGYLFLFSRRRAEKFPQAFRAATASVFVGLITAGAMGFWYIDNPGHAGGALAGLLLAALMVDQAVNYGDEVSEAGLEWLGWAAMAILIAGAVLTSLAMLSA